ncbi:tRNA (adenosine(37)-N6)-dimethylallyltransferase MiaA [Trueperella sp. LYQ141]|uniref:tRNA (adenosine(37)-N6)-dimethylallyltransferase MiaA n=1 Tax=Trueperella sp. LYQ141 TaxID=3391058 RepID=UPI0039831119
MNAVPIIAVVGPTACGKTDLSIDLAQRLGGAQRVEIISADAMQLYRGMDIGTAKITHEERQGIAHHQLDVLDVTQSASVAAYQQHARTDLEKIRQRGKIPMIVGGSGLYVSGLLDELQFPGTSPHVREELEEIVRREGLEVLVAELAQRDPHTYATIDLHNPRRVIRALEVVRLTGRSYTPEFPRHTSHYPAVLQLGIRRDPQLLRERIAGRTRRMFESGLLEEVQGLCEHGLRDGPTASRATGYAQAIAVLDGQMAPEQAQEDIATATWKLTRKQRKWFGADPRIIWNDAEDHLLDWASAQVERFLNNE